jgi:hypothetical protein
MSHGRDTRYLNGKLYFKTLLYVLFLFTKEEIDLISG